ncbi:MAG: homoserine dehydrogenase [Acidobacteria bacterium RIFCSPLOWO2_02_FULL_65_29]|nr:MAG: homoserine dehydrogenase [Acidobacteria bacterium RIFCSPLOWO2_02_FULL_65_29]
MAKPSGSRVALLGFGTVGQAVARILCSGEVPQVQLTHIFNRNVDAKRVDWVPASVRWTDVVEDILASDADIVVELVGGLHPAYEWVRSALLAGKSVVTANKQLMAHYGTELLDLARAQGREVRFEASVAGGIPVLRALQEGLAGDRLVEVRGILNGTCNYILSRMQADAVSFGDALAEAQKAGYAEADPTEDLDGADAAAKLAIIAAVGLRRPVRVTDIATRSIRPIEPVDFEYARQLGCTIRQIARASVEDSGAVFAAVRPALVPLSSGFGQNAGSQNLVTVRGVFGGETSFSGHGAGGSPTAVAVVSDVLSVRRAAGEAAPPSEPTPFHIVSGDFVAPHYVRFTVNDKPGILAQVTAAYARYGINIEGVLQLPKFRKDRLPFVTTLEECSESVLDRALAEVAQSDFHVQAPLSLPIFA